VARRRQRAARARRPQRHRHPGCGRLPHGRRQLRSETDEILCLTTSGIPGRNLGTEERLAPLVLRPEMASFDAGSINTEAGVFVNDAAFLDAASAVARDNGVKLELECFDTGMIVTALR
jgi:3-keto-5-aminohexanoate cleavage enzyme